MKRKMLRRTFLKQGAFSVIAAKVGAVGGPLAWASDPVASRISPGNLRCERRVNPDGVGTDKPILSWKLTGAAGARGLTMSAYEIQCAASVSALQQGRAEFWDSGKVASSNSYEVEYAGQALRSFDRVSWRVRVWDGAGSPSAWSEPASWNVGVLSVAEWTAKWITAGELNTPLFRHEFIAPANPKAAMLYASALGVYRIYINGKPVSDAMYAPGWTDYKMRVQYQTYDVSNLMLAGVNVITAQLAPGWYAGKIAWFGPAHYGKNPHLMAWVRMTDQQGTVSSAVTDETWKASTGPVVAADNYDGETYDARLDNAALNKPGADVSQWTAVTAFQPDIPIKIDAQVDPLVRVVREFKPVSMKTLKPGTTVYSFAQNITGVCRIKVRGDAGATVQLRHAEALLADGTLNVETLRNKDLAKALATDHYTLRGGGEEVYQPHFTFHGFQHVEITGPNPPLTADQVTALVMVTDVPEIGQFQTSNPLVNRIQSNLHWSGRDAFLSIPMDCPQRSERLGWMGDANFYVPTATFNFDMSTFYAKWMRDIADAQAPSGMMSNVAPLWGKPGYGYGGGWGDAGVGIPYAIWQAYGDTRILRQYYDNMARWIELLRTKSTAFIIPAGLAPAGDWQNQQDDTPKDLIATAYFAHDARQMAQMAKALTRDADAAKYEKLFSDIAVAFAAKYLKADGTIATGSQTAQLLGLYLKLIPTDDREGAFKVLVKNIEAHANHLTTGFVGTRWLLPTLADEGRADIAYLLLQQTTLPSWGYMVSKGATTIWEGWDVIRPDGTIKAGQNSLNHCVFGSVGDWMYRYVGGLRPDPEKPGYKHFFVAPQVGNGVDSAKLIYQAPSGEIAIAWVSKKDRFEMSVRVPCNSSATITLPPRGKLAYKENGNDLATAVGVSLVKTDPIGGATVTVGSGDYRFSVA